MDYSQTAAFDNVKFEKAKAIARYNRLKKISKLLQFSGSVGCSRLDFLVVH